tara:strand:- start:66 stop:632 length:567 start_codon:yes stop_codon:yes gene_type:complete
MSITEGHELSNKWNLYLQYKDLSTNYSGNVEKLIEINTIEEFWGTINNIPNICELFSDGYHIKKIKKNNSTPCCYSFFREEIQPFWEDPKNINGFEFSIKENNNLMSFNNLWISSLLELISNKSVDYNSINGIRIVDCTKGKSLMYRLEFWFSDEKCREEMLNIIKNNFITTKSYTFSFRIHQNMKEK